MQQIQRLLEIMSKLRDPKDGCEWDLEQTFESIAPYTIEEAYEVSDAIDNGDIDKIKEELGDLLFQVVFQSQVASDNRLFDFEDVARSISDKMIRRHPHVFGDKSFSRDELKAHWEEVKAAERSSGAPHNLSAIDGVALALPALTRAEKIQQRASRVGFDWDSISPVLEKLDEELTELRAAIGEQLDETASSKTAVQDELGDLLFSVANVARHLKIDPEVALRSATGKFERRFRYVENAVIESGSTMESSTEAELDVQWRSAKQQLP